MWPAVCRKMEIQYRSFAAAPSIPPMALARSRLSQPLFAIVGHTPWEWRVFGANQRAMGIYSHPQPRSVNPF
jgi:hypothetical protein